MSDNEELDPTLVRALREIPSPSVAMRDRHIATALAEMSPTKRSAGTRRRALGGVAAAVLLTLGTVTYANRGVSAPDLASEVTSTVPVKGSADCSQELAVLQEGAQESLDITHDGQTYVVLVRDSALDIYAGTPPCTAVGTLGFEESLRARDNDTAVSDEVACTNQDVIRTFSATAGDDEYSMVVLRTENGISVRFADRCDSDLDSIALP
jgi:hypothetical protein